jgi:predicted DNA repair protein MutK
LPNACGLNSDNNLKGIIMAGASLLTLLDDIATILDDVAAMSKVAARKTAGVLGDDLALNAQQVSGVASERELPVVWAVAKGSFINKLILVPAALLISAFIPWAVTPLLMFGGLFLCYEGFEKLHHSYQHQRNKNQQRLVEATGSNDSDDHLQQVTANVLSADLEDLKQHEAEKVKGAIRTDFVLSAEIIAISLGVVAHMALLTQFMTLSIIAVIMTVGVYGLVAGIVKIDDLGLYLSQRKGQGLLTRLGHSVGLFLLSAAPYLMKGLTFIGTIAMFMVGGGILTHGIHILTVWIEMASGWINEISTVGPVIAWFTPSLLNGLFGLFAGGLALLLMSLVQSSVQKVRCKKS